MAGAPDEYDISALMALGDAKLVERTLSRRITVDVGLDYRGMDDNTKAFMERLIVEIHEYARDRADDVISIWVGDTLDEEPIQ